MGNINRSDQIQTQQTQTRFDSYKIGYCQDKTKYDWTFIKQLNIDKIIHIQDYTKVRLDTDKDETFTRLDTNKMYIGKNMHIQGFDRIRKDTK